MKLNRQDAVKVGIHIYIYIHRERCIYPEDPCMAYSPTFTIKHDPNVGKYTIHGSYKGYIYIFTYIFKYRERYTSIYTYIYTTPNDFPQTRSTTAVIHFFADSRRRMETNLAEQLVRETQLDWTCFFRSAS